ncbi:hypothetical protein E1286_01495 [Nonomuraea terrae]|uniref:Uncharacterized protein n=1 Tax=Nonomuraea terrae TaxID=2530383 RepID=A0A4R4ZJU4_9ACTN|nr:hypothetical protein [Nonomuraea terrae]TDD57002.1 hypothetical protein E1286_01495 [Nonomuraea terrae]
MHDDTSLLRRIAATPALSGILRELIEFDVEDLESVDGSTARLLSGESLHAIACDGAAGRFFLVGREARLRHVLYADSEGSAGLVGSSLSNALATMVALPNWRDLLNFSGGGDLGQMRRAQAWLEEGMRRRHPDLDELQAVLVSELGLVVPDDPVLALWDSVRATDPDIDFIDDADGGLPWGSLFHEWTIERLMRR